MELIFLQLQWQNSLVELALLIDFFRSSLHETSNYNFNERIKVYFKHILQNKKMYDDENLKITGYNEHFINNR